MALSDIGSIVKLPMVKSQQASHGVPVNHLSGFHYTNCFCGCLPRPTF